MKIFRISAIIAAMIFSSSALSAQQQQQPKDMRTMAEEATDALNKMLDLEDWQCFKLDSTFFADYTEVTEEFQKLKRSGATNTEAYLLVQDRVYARMDSTIQTILTPAQWTKYLKSEFGREKRARDKRVAKRASAKK